MLIEAEWQDLVDEVWVVATEPETAIKRMKNRNNLNEEQAQARLDSQLTNTERRKHSDVFIANSGTEKVFRELIQKQWERLQRRIRSAERKRAASGRKQ